MPAAPVIANNTPLVALWVLGRLDILRDLYSEVLIPEAVYDEFLAAERGRRQAVLEGTPWIKPVALVKPQRALAYVGLGQGEAEVLALAEERSAALVLIDERKDRRYARRLGIPVTGTLGLLLLAKEQQLVTAVSPLIGQLQEAGLYLAPPLIAATLRLAGE